MSDLTDRADSRLNQARADRLNTEIKTASDPTPRPTVYLGEQGDRSLVQRLGEGVTPSGVLQTNGGIPSGGLVQMHGNSVDAMPRVKQKQALVIAEKPVGKIKYLYSLINGSNRELYVGGYQKQAKLVGTFPLSGGGGLIYAAIDNLGGKRYEINLVRVLSGGNTTYPQDTSHFLYGYGIYSLEKNGVSSQQVGVSALLDNLGSFRASQHLGYGFYQRGLYRYYEGGIDKYTALRYSDTDFYAPTYSLALFNDRRLLGSSNLAIRSLSTIVATSFFGNYDYFALPRDGINPLKLTNVSNPFDTGSGYTGLAYYTTARIDKTGTKGVGALQGPVYTFPGNSDDVIAPTYTPVWYDDNGVTIVTGTTFDVYRELLIGDNYIDLIGEKFYTFSKASLDIAKDQKLTVKTYDKNFNKLSELTMPAFKASKLGSGLIIHQASFHP